MDQNDKRIIVGILLGMMYRKPNTLADTILNDGYPRADTIKALRTCLEIDGLNPVAAANELDVILDDAGLLDYPGWD